MKQLITTFILYILITCFTIPSVAYANGGDVEVQSLLTQTLNFSKQPIRIDGVVAMPDEAIAVIYYTAGTKPGTEEYRFDFFSLRTGIQFCQSPFCQVNPAESQVPHAQIILQRDRFSVRVLSRHYFDGSMLSDRVQLLW